jgi:WD40 repeat protein/energy-coupling factor transporter ATP-binding protein EcfA2
MTSNQESYPQSNSNPFPGLRAFKDSESHLFFGREENISDVLAKLDKSHFVAVVGTSGTGKSSLIKAGVLPAIVAPESKQKDEEWKVISINPGSSPMENLARAVCQNPSLIDPSEAKDFEANLLKLMNGNPLGLVQAMRPILDSDQRLLILIDQFEEVFRFSSEERAESKGEYDMFVRLIIETVRQRDVPIYAILTLRSDFLGDCVAFEGLPEAINDGHYLVPRMTKAQLKRAITGPIDFSAGKISPRLIQHITEDLGSSADQLPILQHAMMRCWDYWKENEQSGDPMDVRHFEAIGDLDDALSNHANEAYDELSATQQVTLEKVLKALTTKKADNRGVRRPMSLENLMTVTKASKDDIVSCIGPFQKPGRSFILPETSNNPPLSTIYDISHESLMRGWHRLTIWVDEEMDSAEFYGRVCTSALLYQNGESALWRNPDLQFALDWKEKQAPIEAWGNLYNDNFKLGIDFVEKSRSAYLLERKKKSRRIRLLRFALIVFFLVISGLALWALSQTNIANQKTIESEVKSKEAIAQKKLADSAKQEALSASEKAEESKVVAEKEAKNSLAQKAIANKQKQIAILEKGKAVDAADLALRKQELADLKSAEANRQKKLANESAFEAQRLRLLSLGQNLANTSTQVANNPELASLLAIQSFDFLSANEGNSNAANLYKAAAKAISDIDPNQTPVVLRHPLEIMALAIGNGKLHFLDRNSTSCTYGQQDIKLQTYVQTGESMESLNTVYMNPNNPQYAMGLNSNDLAVYKSGQAQHTRLLSGHTALVRAVQFRLQDPTIISGGRDSTLILWNSDGSHDQMKFSGRIKTISALQNESYCYVGCENGQVYRVDLKNKTSGPFAARESSRAEKIVQSETGDIVAIAFSDGVIQILNKAGNKIKELSSIGAPLDLIIDKKNELLIIASSAKLIQFYTLSNLNMLPIDVKLNSQMKGMDLDPVTQNLYIYCSDRSIYKYPVKVKNIIGQLQGKVSRTLTEDEWSTFIGNDIPYLSNVPKPVSTTEQ